MKKQIPNLLTLFNLLCGILGILAVFNGRADLVPVFILLSLAADFFDGMVARALNVQSELGKQLDSLADLVSFGVLPGFVILHLFHLGDTIDYSVPASWMNSGLIILIIPLAAAYRLGKFNIDTRQTSEFLGLPTPAATIYLVGLLMIHLFGKEEWSDIILSDPFLIANAVVISALMVSEIPMFSFKLKSFKWSENRLPFIFLLVVVVLLISFGLSAPSMIILFYIALSIGKMLAKRKPPVLSE